MAVQNIQVHFSFGAHASKRDAAKAMRQLKEHGPFDLYSPEVAMVSGQSGLYLRNLEIKNKLISIAKSKKPAGNPKVRLNPDFFDSLGENYVDFGGFAFSEYCGCLQNGIPFSPLSIREVPIEQANILSVRNRAQSDIDWEKSTILNLRVNLAKSIESVKSIWPTLGDLETIRVFARFGAEHAPMFALGKQAHSGDSSLKFTYSFDSAKDQQEFEKNVLTRSFGHGDLDARIGWMESLTQSDLSILFDAIKQIPGKMHGIFSKNTYSQ